MTRGSETAARLKRLSNKWRRQYGKPSPVEPTDPLEQMLLAILARDTTDARARRAWANLQEVTVDVNDLRVTTVADIVEALGDDYPDATERARRIRAALKNLFDRENVLSLDFLRERGRREARQYLESLEGVDAFTAASVVLWSLGGHAIPLDTPMLEVLRREGAIGGDTEPEQAHSFLERHVAAADAQAFTTLLRKAAAGRARSSEAAQSRSSSKVDGQQRRATKKQAARTRVAKKSSSRKTSSKRL